MAYITFIVIKLIRDKLQEKMRKDGVIVHQRMMEHEEYLKALNKKLLEESQECIDSKNKQELMEEIGDVLEVLNAMAKAHNIEFKDIEEARFKKLQTHGGFENKIFCTTVDVEESNPKRAYLESKYKKLEKK